jgi:hypothetical protein
VGSINSEPLTLLLKLSNCRAYSPITILKHLI